MMQKGYPGDCTVTGAIAAQKTSKKSVSKQISLSRQLGVPRIFKSRYGERRAVVIDVGTTRVPSDKTKSGFKLTGDVAFHEVAPKCSYITPVPGESGR